MANVSLPTSPFVPPCYLKTYSVSFLDRYLRATHSIVAPMNALALIFSTTLNLLILIAVIKDARLRSPSTLLLCSIAVKDLLIVTILQPVAVYRSSLFLYTGNFCLKSAVDGIRPFLVLLYRCTSLTIWVLISTDRWIAIRRATAYRSLFTKKRAYISITAALVFSLALSYAATWGMDKRSRYLVVFIQFGLTSVIISAIQISVYRSIKAHGNAIGAIYSVHATQDAVERRVTGTVAYSVIAVAVIYLPIITVSFLRYLGSNYFLLTSPSMEMLLLSNAAINPVIWLKTSKQLRRAVTRIAPVTSYWRQRQVGPTVTDRTQLTVASSAVSNVVSIMIRSAWNVESSSRRPSTRSQHNGAREGIP